MSYYTDINNYVIPFKGMQNANAYGLDKNATDNFQAITDAINSNYRVIMIGNDAELYAVSKPFYLNSNKTYLFRGEFKIKNGDSSLLTDNVTAGSNSFKPQDPSKFKVGEWVAITDNAQIAFYATLRGTSGKVTEVTEDTVIFDSIAAYNYTTANGAYAAHCQGVAIAETPTNVKIIGINGAKFNGNRANQSQIHPVRNVPVIEDQRAACGLALYKSNNVIVDGLTVDDSLMHNYSISGHDGSGDINSHDVILRRCIANRGHDKNFLVRDILRVTVDDCEGNDATWEDGLIFYSTTDTAVVNNFKGSGNRRSALYWNSNNNTNLVATNTYTRNNQNKGVYVISKNAVYNGIDTDDMVHFRDQYEVDNIVMNDVIIDGCTQEAAIKFDGGVKNITINNLIIRNCNCIAILATNVSGNTPINVVINGGGIYNHTGTKTDIAVGSDITFNNFEGLT